MATLFPTLDFPFYLHHFFQPLNVIMNVTKYLDAPKQSLWFVYRFGITISHTVEVNNTTRTNYVGEQDLHTLFAQRVVGYKHMKKVLVTRTRIRKSRAPVTKKREPGLQPSVAQPIVNGIYLKFSPDMLDLGNISAPCQEIAAVAAIFDLSGFTKFCNQVDSYLAIPQFLNTFLEWFFDSMRKGLTEKKNGKSTYLWSEFPLMVKFLGDGLLLVWNTRSMQESQICRITTMLFDMCNSYKHELYPQISLKVNKPPRTLRCGIARGKIFRVGNGKDYVGHCINNASRLSHLSSLSFCFSQNGFQVTENMPARYSRLFIPKLVNIRGVGENERVWIVKEEFRRLPEREKAQFRDLENIFV